MATFKKKTLEINLRLDKCDGEGVCWFWLISASWKFVNAGKRSVIADEYEGERDHCALLHRKF